MGVTPLAEGMAPVRTLGVRVETNTEVLGVCRLCEPSFEQPPLSANARPDF